MANKIILSFLAVFFVSTSAMADAYFKGAFLYENDKSGNDGTSNSSSRQVLDFAGGYLDPKGWMYGALYSMDTASSGTSSASRTAMGPAIGYMSTKENGAFGMFTYFYTATMGTLGGSGIQLDVGYKFAVRKLSFGAQFSKKNITFDKSNGVALTTKYIEDRLDPYIFMLIVF